MKLQKINLIPIIDLFNLPQEGIDWLKERYDDLRTCSIYIDWMNDDEEDDDYTTIRKALIDIYGLDITKYNEILVYIP